MSNDTPFMQPYLSIKFVELCGRSDSQAIVSINCDEMFDIVGGVGKYIQLQGAINGSGACKVLITPEILSDLKQYVAWIEQYTTSRKPVTDESELETEVDAEH